MTEEKGRALQREQLLKHPAYAEIIHGQDVTDRLPRGQSGNVYRAWRDAVWIYRQSLQGKARYAHSLRHSECVFHAQRASLAAKKALLLLARKTLLSKKLAAELELVNRHIICLYRIDPLALSFEYAMDEITLQWVLRRTPPPCGTRCVVSAADPFCACELGVSNLDPLIFKTTEVADVSAFNLTGLSPIDRVGYLRLFAARLSVDFMKRRGPKSDEEAQDLINAMCGGYEDHCNKTADHTNVKLLELISDFLSVHKIMDINIDYRVKRYVAYRLEGIKKRNEFMEQFVQQFGDLRKMAPKPPPGWDH